jgi:hypothetical protein
MKSLFALLLLPAALHAELKWARTEQTLAYVPGQKEVRVEFPCKNTGKSPVKFTDIRGGCVCCTSAHATKKVLAPGESGSVVMRVDFRGKTLPLAKGVNVSTDDGNIEVLLLKISTPGGKEIPISKWRAESPVQK